MISLKFLCILTTSVPLYTSCNSFLSLTALFQRQMVYDTNEIAQFVSGTTLELYMLVGQENHREFAQSSCYSGENKKKLFQR
jgi:hypothetical protein